MERLAHLLTRLIFALGGVAILYHQTFVVREAQWEVLLVALWMIGVPPALWLDSVREILDDRRKGERRAEDDRRDTPTPERRHRDRRHKKGSNHHDN